MGRLERLGEFVRTRGLGIAVGAAALGLLVAGVRGIRASRDAPPPRKVMQYTMVTTQPPPPPREPPPPVTPPKEVEPEQTTRVDLKAADLVPSEEPRPAAEPSGGQLSLAAEGEGPGDAFNLAGKPGGRGILTGGGLGDGTGEDGLGAGGSPGSRFGWYYAKLASEIESAFRANKHLLSVSTRVEVRVWADPTGRISRIQLVRSTGDPRLDEAIRSIEGLHLREAPPRDIPMPMVARLTARRPE